MERKEPIILPRRGDIFLAGFDSTIGAEIKKTRPALIIQNDIGNQYSSLTIVAALSSYRGKKLYPTEILVHPPEGGVVNPSVVILDQVRTVDKRRLKKRLGRITPHTMTLVDRALMISLGLRNI